MHLVLGVTVFANEVSACRVALDVPHKRLGLAPEASESVHAFPVVGRAFFWQALLSPSQYAPSVRFGDRDKT